MTGYLGHTKVFATDCALEFSWRAVMAHSEKLDTLADYYAAVSDLSRCIDAMYEREIERGMN